ncbi:polyamine ABC transporter substrate-binding protein [Mumia zhuanghuii]|uniref:Spermidine/putrescine ABC transporter substrate-binding protein n=1 Tax=Mumia zhuanghuii TaxID=2585211 RepID=A0A5C4N4D8_9ACTN|nr:spermidine/putrescine ABC transporter substrate-binding protein [Mumia zhuanghuii]TNC35676.1 spermidine/putrescine ABC transporter substrate-binding protein [Mumia zhuanghuii]TNC51707.1 spermidine/putrescine ABC transporter substrate-binding protein [Mumia zhuanghuii]
MKAFASTSRRALAAAAGIALVAALAACGSDGDDSAAADLDPDADLSKQSIVVSNWADYMPDDIATKFEEATGASMEVTNHATNEEIMAKLTAGSDSGIDVAFVSGQFAQALAEQGLVEPIHADLIPNLENLAEPATTMAYDKGNKISVPYTWGTTGICYRSDLVKEAPTSWNDLLEPDDTSKGKVTMMATERWLMLPAQKALGFSANTTDEDEMAQVKDKLVAAKKNLLAYDDTTFYERLISGEAVMVQAWDGWCNYGTTENKDITFTVPEEGSDLWVDTMVVLKTSKNKEAAHAFINYLLEPENGAWAAENILYNVPNQKAMDLLPAELKAQYPPLQVTAEELLKGESLTDLGEAATLYSQLVTEITSS